MDFTGLVCQNFEVLLKSILHQSICDSKNIHCILKRDWGKGLFCVLISATFKTKTGWKL